jgi:hypothetical protein
MADGDPSYVTPRFARTYCLTSAAHSKDGKPIVDTYDGTNGCSRGRKRRPPRAGAPFWLHAKAGARVVTELRRAHGSTTTAPPPPCVARASALTALASGYEAPTSM